MTRNFFIAASLVVLGLVSLGLSRADAQTYVNTSAYTSGESTQVCVADTAGGTAMPTSALIGRRAVEIQNQGAATIFCTVDGSAPLTNGTNGREIAADATWSLDVGSRITIKCIAASTQSSGNCTAVTELK